NDQDRHDCIEYINANCTELSAWKWFFSLIIKIPSEDEKGSFKTIQRHAMLESRNDDNNTEKKKIDPQLSQSKDEQENTISTQSDYLKKQLKYCIVCIGWKDLIDKYERQIMTLGQLHGFMKKTFGQLCNIIKNGQMNYSLYQFVKTDRNEMLMKSFCSTCMDLQLWTSTNEKLDSEIAQFDELKSLQQNLHIVSEEYFVKTPNEFEAFNAFSKEWEYCTLLHIQTQYKEQLQLLKNFAKNFQLMVNRKDSSVFRVMWNNNMKKFRAKIAQTSLPLEPSAPAQAIPYRKQSKLEHHIRQFSVDNYMQIFEIANAEWEHLSEGIQKNTLQFADSQWFKHLNWKLEMNMLLPDIKEEEVDKIRQTKMQQITGAIRLHEWSFAWKKLKQATEIIQRCHKDTMNIEHDQTWQTFEQTLSAIDRLLQELQEKKKVEIRDAAELYDACVKYGRDVVEHVLKLGLIIENEDKLKEFATNELFMDMEKFDFTMKTLEGSRQKYRHLATTLRQVHPLMQESIWMKRFETMTALAMALLQLPNDRSTFVILLGECLHNKCLPSAFQNLREKGIQLRLSPRL
ncbi:hypothetical protein RFI_25360, partial [Reticulomyxa filosa]